MDILTIFNNDAKDVSVIMLSDYGYHPVRSLNNALKDFGLLCIQGDEIHEGLEASAAGQFEMDGFTFQLSYVEAGDIILFKYNPDRDEH